MPRPPAKSISRHRIDNLPAATRERIRNDRFGMIFQFYHLLPELTTLENVLAPLMIGQASWNYWRSRREFVQRATKLARNRRAWRIG